MKITFLGTGTSQGIPMIGCDCSVCCSNDPKDERLRSSILVEWDDLTLVVDTGPDFRYQMLRAGVRQLDAVLYTHEHTDHVAGLDDVRAFNYFQKGSMPLYASDHTEEDVRKRFAYAFGDYPGVPAIRFERLTDEPFEIKGHCIVPISVMHRDLQTYGFRFDDFTYITDANHISPQAANKIKGSKVLVLNALRHEPHYSHFTLAEALDEVERLGVERAYFTHISHQLGRHEDVEISLPGHARLAFDGLKLDF